MTTYTSADLRAWRAREKLTQTQAATLFGVAQRTLSNWENELLPANFSERFEAVLEAYYEVKPKP